MSGLFHLGDPRHNGGPLPIGALLLPFFFAASVWKRGDARRVRISLVAGGILVVVMAPIMGQAAELGLDDIRGLLQRVLTLGLFPPIGLVAWYLIQGIREVASDHDSTVSLPAIT
jgi:Na+/proline symporter